MAEAVAAYGRSTVEAAVRRHLRVAKLKRRADGPERTERTESEGAGTERTERTGRTGRTESEGAGTDWTNQTETTAQTGSEAERTEVDGTGAEHRNRRGEKRSRGGEEEQGDSRERGGGKRARPEVAGTEERIGGTGGGLKRVKAEVGEEEENPNCGRVESRGHFGAPSNRGVSERGIVDSTGQRKQEMGLTGSAQTEGGALHSDTLASRFFSNDDTVREPGGSVGLGSSRHQEDRLSRQTYRPFLAVPKPELESSLANGAPTLTVSKAELDSSPGGPFPVVHFAPLAGTSLENGPTGPAREGGLGQASPRLTPQTSDSSAAAGRCRSPSTEPFLKKEAAATVSH